MINYRVADTGYDYRLAHDLIKAEGLDDVPLSFPTILAVNGEGLVGVLGTERRNGIFTAGPLVLKSGQRRVFTLLHLVDAYENVLFACGVESYIFSIEVTNTQWIDKVEKVLNIKPWQVGTELAWYKRNLTDGR